MSTKLFDKVFQYFLENVSKGIPELKIPSFDPLKLENLEHEEQFTALCCTAAEANFSNFTVRGLTKLKLPAIDHTGSTVYATTTVKDLEIDGNYTLQGHACIVPLSGDSTFHMDIDALHIRLSVELTKQATIIPKVKVEVNTQDATLNLSNVQPGVFSNRLNTALHSRFAATVNKRVERGIAEAVQDELQKAIDKHAADGLFEALREAL